MEQKAEWFQVAGGSPGWQVAENLPSVIDTVIYSFQVAGFDRCLGVGT
jgi:hypothetical protein